MLTTDKNRKMTRKESDGSMNGIILLVIILLLVVFLTLLITRQWGGLFLFLLALYLMFR
jgi:hypothetical protein